MSQKEGDPLEDCEAMYHMVVAEVLREMGYHDRAEESFMKAVSMDPWNTAIRVRYGAFLAHTGRYEAAIGEFRRILDMEPGNMVARLNLSQALEHYGMLDQATHEILQCLHRTPDSPILLHAYGRLLELGGNAPAAEACYRESLLGGDDNHAAHCDLGLMLYRQGNLEEARRELWLAITLEPTDLAAAYTYGKLVEDSGEYSGTEAGLRQLVSLEPGLETAHYRYGVLQERLGRFDEALAQYAWAVQLDPDNRDACLAYASLLHRLGCKDIDVRIARLLDASPDDGIVYEIVSSAGEPEAMQHAYYYHFE